MRVAIIGNSGSGKSTLASALATAHGLPVLDLDTVAWEPGQVAVARDASKAVEEVDRFCRSQPGWVIEGCYESLIEAALAHRPLLVFLDPGVRVCEARCRQRPWEPHKYASRREQDERLAFLIDWVRGYDTREGALSRAAHEALFDRYEGPKRRLTGLASIEDLPAWDR